MSGDRRVTAGEITIRLDIVDGDTETVITFGDDLSALEMLGMLEMARDSILRPDEWGDDD